MLLSLEFHMQNVSRHRQRGHRVLFSVNAKWDYGYRLLTVLSCPCRRCFDHCVLCVVDSFHFILFVKRCEMSFITGPSLFLILTSIIQMSTLYTNETNSWISQTCWHKWWMITYILIFLVCLTCLKLWCISI